MKYLFTAFIALQMFSASAQVGDIKRASSRNASSSGERSSGGNSAFFFYFLADAVNGLASWQQHTLRKRESNPSLVSLDVIAQVATQPSRYYLVNPRVRGNWGLFSTDFRVNYLLEETPNGVVDLSSIDWQLVQLNVVTTRNVIARLGGGVMKENFGGRESFFESTVGVAIQSSTKKVGVVCEYRSANDFETDVTTRREFNAHFEKRLMSMGYWNTYLTIGAVYQNYYESISVWGIQAGLAFKVFAPAVPVSEGRQ